MEPPKTDEVKKDPETELSNSKPIVIAVVGILIGVIVAFTGFYLWKMYSEKQNEIKNLKEQTENLKKGEENATNEEAAQGNANNENSSAEDVYAGWETYYNYEVGYMLRYPANWTVNETDEWNEITDQAVKYISIDTPDNKFFLYFGLKLKSDDFGISNRTGVGAGDVKDNGNMTILGTNVSIKELVYKGKIQEMFFGALGSVNTKDGKYSFGSSLSPHGTSTGVFSDLDTAKKILESVKIIERKKISCVSSLSSADKQTMKNWKTYKNDKYDYSFKYPDDWTAPDTDKNVVTLNGDGGDTTFQFRSGPATAIDYMGYKTDSKKNVKIACQNGKATYLSGDPVSNPGSDNDRMIFAQFEKNGSPHLIMFTYKYISASISSDMVEMYNLILKSVTFN